MEARGGFALVLVNCILFSFLYGLGSCQTEEGSNRIINTTLGSLVGATRFVLNGNVTSYKGIRYAEPPVGSLRFAKPRPSGPWQGVMDATSYGPDCPQTQGGAWSEDCLTLNIFVPGVNLSAPEPPFPVMVWIHGGGFSFGTGSIYDGSVLADLGRVVVVTLNYRLGIMGFLSTGDDSARGNYGLWDQRLAIQWVKEHIASFHGDPDVITVFGESAGAISAAMQAISPVNDRSLFQRVVLESGAASLVFTNTLEEAAVRTGQLGSLLGCGEPADSRLLLECLRGAPADDILAAGAKLPVGIVQLSPYYPIVDGEFFPDYLHRLSASGLAGQYDLLVGMNSDEGSIAAGIMPPIMDSSLMSLLIGEAMKYMYRCSNYRELTETVKFMYTASTGLGDLRQNLRTALELAGDAIFLAPAVLTARDHSLQSASTNTYMYYFTYLTEVSENPYPPDLIDGAGHGSEIPFVFGVFLLFNPGSVSASLSKSTVGYWTNFAKTGNPNGDGLPPWPQFDAENETYIILEPNITTAMHFKADRMPLWNDHVPANAVPSDPNTQCSVDVPMGSGTVDRPDTKTVEITSADGRYVLGSVVGSLRVADEAVGGEEIAGYSGIPYAKPPLGDLRFRPPKDTGSWGSEPLGIPERPPPACPQDVALDPWMVRLGSSQTSEDCLTLNIHAPTSGSALPVVVFIHPGFGVAGTSSVYDAAVLASGLKAVVVVANYRLGALGFLSTGDEKAPGNYGLHDVLAALKWVSKYIGSFGGDASRVTVVGHGAGAELAHFLVLSEKSRDLFQRAVLMSSTAISPPVNNTIQPNASAKAQALAKAMDCPTTNSELMIDCLRERPASDFVLHTHNPAFGRAFPVVVDQDILKDSPMNLLKAGQFGDVDLILGVSSDENANQSVHLLPGNLTHCPTADEIKELIREVSRTAFHNPEVASVALATEYLGEGGLGDACQTRGGFRRFMQDYLSVWSILETARRHSDNANRVYVYSFDHEPPEHYQTLLPPLAGPSHGDDLQFLFGDPYSRLVDDLQLTYRLPDKQMSLEIMASLGNFIRDGHPGMSLSGAEWPMFDSGDFRFMALDPCPDSRSGLDAGWDRTLRFWSALMTTLTAPPKPAPPPPQTTAPHQPCYVGEGIGLRLTLDEASTLIQAMIGVSICLLVVVVVLSGGCVAYRSRAIRSESGKMPSAGIEAAYAMGEQPYSTMNGIDNVAAIQANSESSLKKAKPKDNDRYSEEIDMASSDSD